MEKQYLINSEVHTLSATVTRCVDECGGTFAICLDRTPFFPEGGGQPSDIGTIDQIKVTHCFESDNHVYHRTATPIEVGTQVTATVDNQNRLVYTQQHTGEHLLSYAYYHLFGVDNVGFHVGEASVFIDLNQKLTQEQIIQGEEFANQMVWENRPISCYTVTDDQLSALPLRKKSDKAVGDIRIVQVQDGDACTCCGTHFSTTAPVGLIKVLKTSSYKEGVRIEFVCGKWALSDYQTKNSVCYEAGASLCVPPHGVTQAIAKLKSECGALSGTLHNRSVRLCALLADQAIANATCVGGFDVAVCAEDLTPKEAKLLLGNLTAHPNTLALVFTPSQDKLAYLCGTGDGCTLDCKYIASVINGLISGKGGGKQNFAQGSGKNDMSPTQLASTILNLLNKQL